MSPLALAEHVSHLVDRAAGDRVLVFGSLPPAGRDLDLIVRDRAAAAITTALRQAGLAENGHAFAAFRCGAAYEVELEPAESLPPGRTGVEALFAEAVPLAGFRHLAEPSPHHRLLLLAFVVMPGSTSLTQARRARIERAQAEDPTAWERAAARAGQWGRPDRLRQLRAAFDDRQRAPRRRFRPRRGALIALSGIDGAGKSFHAESLAAVLADLGAEAAVEWLPLGQNESLDRLARPVKRVLELLASAAPADTPAPASEHDPGTALRARSPAVNYVWSTLVALTNALSHARRSVPHLLAGRVVIFDRYELDSYVRLRFSYGADRSWRLQRWLIRALSPRPRCSFFLDLEAETSLARKEDRWDLDQLRQHADLYRAEYARHGVIRLDGERDAETICAEIAEAVWRRLA